MNFLDGALFPENQEKLVITAAPYGPEWFPRDFPEDIAVSMKDQVQKAIDCYNAGATVLHVHVREEDGKGSKRLSKFNELLVRLREAVPDMVLQVGGSISFAPETEGEKAKWLSDDTRHMLAELKPKPDQVTVTVNTSQMNVVEQMEFADIAGTSMAEPEFYNAYREMVVPGGPGWAEEHVRRLSAAGIQSAFQFYNINSFETVERMIRRGVYKGPLVMNWVAIGGGMDAPNIYNLANFVRATPDGAVLTLESSMRNVLPINMIAIALGLHVRCGIEDNLWTQDRQSKMGTVKQIEQLVRISREFGREIATGKEARRICKIDTFYSSVDERLPRTALRPIAQAANVVSRSRSCASPSQRYGPDRSLAHRRGPIWSANLPKLREHQHVACDPISPNRRSRSAQARDHRGGRAGTRPGARAALIRGRELHRRLLPHRPLSIAAAEWPGLGRGRCGRGRGFGDDGCPRG